MTLGPSTAVAVGRAGYHGPPDPPLDRGGTSGVGLLECGNPGSDGFCLFEWYVFPEPASKDP